MSDRACSRPAYFASTSSLQELRRLEVHTVEVHQVGEHQL